MTNKLTISRDKSLKKAILPCTGPHALVNTTLDNEYQPIPEANASPCVIGIAKTKAAMIPPSNEVKVNTIPVWKPRLLKRASFKEIPLFLS